MANAPPRAPTCCYHTPAAPQLHFLSSAPQRNKKILKRQRSHTDLLWRYECKYATEASFLNVCLCELIQPAQMGGWASLHAATWQSVPICSVQDEVFFCLLFILHAGKWWRLAITAGAIKQNGKQIIIIVFFNYFFNETKAQKRSEIQQHIIYKRNLHGWNTALIKPDFHCQTSAGRMFRISLYLFFFLQLLDMLMLVLFLS